MLDQIESRDLQSEDKSARNALQDEAMQASVKAVETKAATQNSQKENESGLSANEQRKLEEAKFFKELYEKSNFELDPFKKGEGPYQNLEHMQKEGKIDMSHEQMMYEANRIQERDQKDLGRNFYKTSDQIEFWTDEEIEQNVKSMVEKVKGIDVSNWQKNIDWNKVKDAGYEFAFMKATEGVTFVDWTFKQNRKGAQDAGLKVGYYHYFHPENSVEAQVKHFCDTVGQAEPDALRLVIDAEDPGKWTRYSKAQRVKMVDDFLQGVQKRLGTTPDVAIYCSPNFAKEILGNAPELEKYSLWIANYGVSKPTIPGPWQNWDFWQYTDNGRVPGIQGPVDINLYNGTDLSQDQQRKKPA